MKSSNPHSAASSAVLIAEPSEAHAGPQRDLSDPRRAMAGVASDRRLEALEQAWEVEEPKFTADECSAMSIQRLRRLCNEAFIALDADFPEWGARDEYEVLSAELIARGQALQNRTTYAPIEG